jgi:hypothetical protein
LENFKVAYNPLHQFISCYTCGVAINDSLFSHFNSAHKFRFLATKKTEIQQFMSRYSLKPLEEINSVLLEQKNNGPQEPVEGLLVTSGYSCDQCGFLTTSKKLSQLHQKKHPNIAYNALFKKVSIQSLTKRARLNQLFEITTIENETSTGEFNIVEFCRNVSFHISSLIARCRLTLIPL